MKHLSRIATKPVRHAAIYFIFFLSCCGIAPHYSIAEDEVVVDRIVAVVNDEIITLYDLNRSLKPYVENIKALGYSAEKEKATLYQFRNDLLNDLINKQLTEQEIKRSKITINQAEVDNYIEQIKITRKLTDEELRSGLAQQGLTLGEYKQEVKRQLERNRLVNREVKSKVVITKEDIKTYYDSHQEKYAGDLKYKLWNIFIKFSAIADDREREESLRKMENVLAKLNQGQSFEEIAVGKIDVPSGVQGSELGLFRLIELSPQLQQVIQSMKTGEYSPIQNNDWGYQIIFVQKVLETSAKPLEEVESEINEILYGEYVEIKFQTWIEDLRKRSHIKIIN